MIFFFLLIPLLALAYLYKHFRVLFTGKQGRLISLLIFASLLSTFLFLSFTVVAILRTFAVVGMSNYLFACILLDLGTLVYWIIKRQSVNVVKYRKISLITVTVVAVGTLFMVGLGMYQNNHYEIREEKISLQHGDNPLRIAFFSDTHLDPLFPHSKMKRLIHDLDSLKPDAIFFGGDLADMGAEELDARGFDTLFQKIKAPLGFWGVAGNHEGYNTARKRTPIPWMRNNGMKWLLDSTACTTLFCVTGRVDPHAAEQLMMERLPLNILERDLSPKDTRPWFVLDHRPSRLLQEERPTRIPDLILSGHTHAGQFFPWTWVIGLVWELSEGYGVLDGIPWFVSSGIGSWGPPVRIGSKTELVIFDFSPSGGKRH